MSINLTLILEAKMDELQMGLMFLMPLISRSLSRKKTCPTRSLFQVFVGYGKLCGMWGLYMFFF
jgi:hypothetical protein